MSRIYNIKLECGCLISEDGGGCCIPCYAEYRDMRKKEDKKALELCEKCWKEYLKKRRKDK